MQSEKSARSVAVEQLVRIEQSGAYAGLMSAPPDLDPRGRRFVTELVAGVTRLRRWLDFNLSRHSRRPVAELDPRLRQILRIAAYEIFEGLAPDYAAVNEAVELTKSEVPKAAGLANAVLRKLAASKDSPPEPTGPLAEQMGIRYSHPTWLVERWLEQFGEQETGALLAWNNRRPSYGLRISAGVADHDAVFARLEEYGAAPQESPYLDDFIRINSVQPVIGSELISDGRAFLQDEAAGLVVRVLDPQPGETIIDACAAPGGKLTYIASLMQNRGNLIAVDEHEGRLRLARRSAEAAGHEMIRYIAADLRGIPAESIGASVERILIDAPCSGTGVLAKRPDLRWRRTPADIADLCQLQDELLDAAAAMVAVTGLIVYGTCTIESEENEHRVDAFLSRHPDFRIESVAPLVPSEMVTDRGFYFALPQRHRIDGAFAARLRRHAT